MMLKKKSLHKTNDTGFAVYINTDVKWVHKDNLLS